jgi:hypothetical protein
MINVGGVLNNEDASGRRGMLSQIAVKVKLKKNI